MPFPPVRHVTDRTVRGRRAVAAVAAVALLAVTAGCGRTTMAAPQGSVPSVASEPTVSAAPRETQTPAEAARNDLASRRLERVLRSGDLTVNVVYQTPLDLRRWTAVRPKPIRVSVSAINGAKQGQKVYLSKMTVNLGLSDGEGLLDAPRALVDNADVSPGFIVNFPNSYDENLLIPAVDTSAVQLTMDVNYELLIQVDPKTKDYAKRTVSDTVVVPIV